MIPDAVELYPIEKYIRILKYQNIKISKCSEKIYNTKILKCKNMKVRHKIV